MFVVIVVGIIVTHSLLIIKKGCKDWRMVHPCVIMVITAGSGELVGMWQVVKIPSGVSGGVIGTL